MKPEDKHEPRETDPLVLTLARVIIAIERRRKQQEKLAKADDPAAAGEATPSKA